MVTTQLPAAFKAFLQSLNARGAEYLVVGGYAVVYHGHVRSTGALDVWIGPGEDNVRRVVSALRESCVDSPDVSGDLFVDRVSIPNPSLARRTP